jgi:hypothetical protein
LEPSDLGRIIDATQISMRIGADTVKKQVYLQFYLPDQTDEKKEQSYTLKLSWPQFVAIADSYPEIKEQVDMFDTLAKEMNDDV